MTKTIYYVDVPQSRNNTRMLKSDIENKEDAILLAKIVTENGRPAMAFEVVKDGEEIVKSKLIFDGTEE